MENANKLMGNFDLNNNNNIGKYQEEESGNDMVVNEETIMVDEMNEVEAVPFYEDIDAQFQGLHKDVFDEELKKAIEHHVSESSSVMNLSEEVDSNKIMIRDLKSSVVTLKVSTSRIEREVKELGDNIGKFNTEKNVLDNSLIDLEFRFNELVTNQENTQSQHNQQIETAAPVHSEEYEEMQAKIRKVIDNLQMKVQQMDKRISIIDSQNEVVKSLTKDIEKHEQMVQNIRKMLALQERELSQINQLKDVSTLVRKDNSTTNGDDTKVLQLQVREFIAKTELNEKSIATAWVGLIAALLLIPIAYFMGKFF